MNPRLHVDTLVCGPLGNNVYLVSSGGGETALAIDPALEAAAAVTRALAQRRLQLALVVATHGHWDHIAEAGALAAQTGAQIVAHSLDTSRITQPPRPMLFPHMEIPPAPVDRELQDGDTVALGDLSLEVLHTPGHTPGSICLYDRAAGVLFSGDTLFAGSYGRYDLPGGDPVALRASLLRLAGLPAGTRVLPGHGPETTIGTERWLSRPPL